MRTHTLFLIIVTSLFFLLQKSALSQTESRDIEDIYERKEEGILGKVMNSIFKKKIFNKNYALIIGLSDYDGYWPVIDSPYYDAKKMRRFLVEEAKFDYVVTLTNKKATKQLITKYMEETFPKMITDKDRFLFYFSGHGTQRQLGQRVRGYLPMLSSGQESWADMTSMREIEEWNTNLHQARHVLFVLDCCFSGLAGVEIKGDRKELYLKDLSKPGHHLLTAGGAKQISYGSLSRWGGSLFTDAFIKGASGGADAKTAEFQQDGIISFNELVGYIKKRVIKEAERIENINQSPRVSNLSTEQNGGEFFFVSEKKLGSGARAELPSSEPMARHDDETKGIKPEFEAQVAEFGIVRVLSYITGEVYVDSQKVGNIESGQEKTLPKVTPGIHEIEVRGLNQTKSKTIILEKGGVVEVQILPDMSRMEKPLKEYPDIEPAKFARTVDMSARGFNRIAFATVKISYRDGAQIVKSGSGVIVGYSRGGRAIILTACHVAAQNYFDVTEDPDLRIQFPSMIAVTIGNRVDAASVIQGRYDVENDLALLATRNPVIESNVVSYNYSRNVHLGQTVFSSGFPDSDELTLSAGVAIRKEGRYIIFDARTQPGSSGGPLVDKHGRMIGLTIYRSDNESSALTMDVVLAIVNEWLKGMRLKKEWEHQKYVNFWERFYKSPWVIATSVVGVGVITAMIWLSSGNSEAPN